MNSKKYISCAAAAFVVIVLGAGHTMRAADDTENKDLRTSRQQLREKLKNMTPEERRDAIGKWREEHPGAAALREKLRQRREETKNLTPEQREAKRKETRAHMEKRLDKLKKKQAGGTLTDREKRRLDRMERVKSKASLQQTDGNQGAKPSDRGKPAEK
jgi:hypothetical protein